MYKVGDIVVHPAHGAAVVKAVQEKNVGTVKGRFIILQPVLHDMKIYVPHENVDHVGLRDPVKKADFTKVMKVLRTGSTYVTNNWQHRFRIYNEKVFSGDLCQVAEVVRNLDKKNKQKGLSTTENLLLERAFTILASEYVCVHKVGREEAMNFFSKALVK